MQCISLFWDFHSLAVIWCNNLTRFNHWQWINDGHIYPLPMQREWKPYQLCFLSGFIPLIWDLHSFEKRYLHLRWHYHVEKSHKLQFDFDLIFIAQISTYKFEKKTISDTWYAETDATIALLMSHWCAYLVWHSTIASTILYFFVSGMGNMITRWSISKSQYE